MTRWQSDPRLRDLVAERRQGTLGRRAFLARLGATAAGAGAASMVGAPPARAQKKVVVTMWDTEPNPATRGAMKIIVDSGAARAVAEQNRSLLPAGIIKVEGDFARGDIVAIETEAGSIIARGLTNYPSAAVDRLRGLRSEQIRQTLGACRYEEVVHKDNLVVTV